MKTSTKLGGAAAEAPALSGKPVTFQLYGGQYLFRFGRDQDKPQAGLCHGTLRWFVYKDFSSLALHPTQTISSISSEGVCACLRNGLKTTLGESQRKGERASERERERKTEARGLGGQPSSP